MQAMKVHESFKKRLRNAFKAFFLFICYLSCTYMYICTLYYKLSLYNTKKNLNGIFLVFIVTWLAFSTSWSAAWCSPWSRRSSSSATRPAQKARRQRSVKGEPSQKNYILSGHVRWALRPLAPPPFRALTDIMTKN